MRILHLSHPAARVYLSETYGWPEDRALRALEITRALSPSPVLRPTAAGVVTLTCPGGGKYTIEDAHLPQERS